MDFVLVFLFLKFYHFVDAAFSHSTTDRALSCAETGILVPLPSFHPNRNDTCICRKTWFLEEYIDEEVTSPGCSGQLDGCDHDCMGGGWCPVANPGCVSSEDRAIMVTKCDANTPIAGDCGANYCSCNDHTDCSGATFCSDTCFEGTCENVPNFCQPCSACDPDVNQNNCNSHCNSIPAAPLQASYPYIIEIPLLTEVERDTRLREECFQGCLQTENCILERQTPDTYLFIYPEEQFCWYGVLCSGFFGTTTPKPYPSFTAEHWRVITNNDEARQFQCGSSVECSGFQNYLNCCDDAYNTIPMCSTKDSIQCTDSLSGGCVDGEHFCDTYKGDTRCVPNGITCKDYYELYTPILLVLAIILIGFLKRFGVFDRLQWYANAISDDEDETAFFVSYSREGFVDGTVHIPEKHRPRFKFSYDNEDKCLVFDNILSSCLAGSIPGGIQLGIVTWIVAWFRAYSTLTKSPNWVPSQGQIVNFVQAVHDITGTMQTFVSVLLVFIMINRLVWFFSVLGNMYRVQGSIASFAMFVGTRVKDRHVLFRVYRYLNLCHVYLHMKTTEHLQNEITNAKLIEIGLLTKEERVALEATWSKRNLVMKWLGTIIANTFAGDDKIQLEKEYSELRQNAMLTVKCINQTIPYSLIQLVLFLTYFWLALMPFAMYHKMTSGQEFVSVTPVASVSTFCVSLCFQAILNIILVLSNPTGKDLDDIDPEALLIETDEALLVFLGGQEDRQGKKSSKITVSDQLSITSPSDGIRDSNQLQEMELGGDRHQLLPLKEGIEMQRRTPPGKKRIASRSDPPADASASSTSSALAPLTQPSFGQVGSSLFE